MKIRKKLYNNESAVSVIVGTLALILVVVVGVVAVATILGTFSSDVSKQTGTSSSVIATKTTLNVAGSDNMDFLTRSLADSYSEENPSVRIKSGIIVPNGVIPAIISQSIDVGALAGNIKSSDLAKNPNVQAKQIGSSAVVVITNTATPGVISITTPIAYADLVSFFTVNTIGGNIKAGAKAVARSDNSAIADIFYQKFLGTTTLTAIPGGAPAQSGDAKVISYVASTENAIGFADYGDVKTAISNGEQNISIISINDNSQTYNANTLSYGNISTAARYNYRSTARNADGSFVWTGNQTDVREYNLSLICPLYYVTKGNPNVVENGFLGYATSPAARSAFIQTNTFSVADF